jgi:2-keto-4-pentenoate hydratase
MSVQALADEITGAYALRRVIAPPSGREADWTIAAGYAVLAELQQRRHASGRRTVGRKVGYANKAVWRAL